MDETAMQGAIGIIIAVGGVLIALYIIAVVVGSISYAVTSGNIKLSPTWNSTITKYRKLVNRIVNKALVREHRLSGPGHIQSRECASDCNHRGRYPYDRHWSLCRPWYLIGFQKPTICAES
jgi:hypothetical protein